MLSKPFAISRGFTHRLPVGSTPFHIITRLLEECGELAEQVNHFEGIGVKREKLGAPDPKKLAKEIGKRVQGKLLYGNYLPKKTDVQFKTFSHPQEAPTREDFLKGCRQLLKEN